MATRYLDEYILTEILVRLPAKSLLRFKCICRRWHSLISDHSFTKAHLKSSLDDSPNPPQRLRIGDFPLLSVKITRACDGWEDARERRISRDKEPFLREGGWLSSVAGSCRGLLCYSYEPTGLGAVHSFFLYNPTTGEYKDLPKTRHYCCPMYGLGYDALSDDFKFITAAADDRGIPTNRFAIYSLKSASWKSLGEANNYTISDRYGSYSNGKLYWCNDMAGRGDRIISFDLASEKFCENSMPAPSFKGLTDTFARTVLTASEGGCLFAYQSRSHRYNWTEVWIMKEPHGLHPTWTKLCDFSTEGIYNKEHTRCWVDIYPLIKDGRIVILSVPVERGERRVDVYDPEEDSWETFTLPQARVCRYKGKITCAESLVSLRGR